MNSVSTPEIFGTPCKEMCGFTSKFNHKKLLYSWNTHTHICVSTICDCYRLQTASGAHSTSCPMDTGAVSLEVKRRGHEADHSPPSNVDV
jgi:hypothetical protein